MSYAQMTALFEYAESLQLDIGKEIYRYSTGDAFIPCTAFWRLLLVHAFCMGDGS